MTPSFHRCPPNQSKVVHLTKGVHKILAGIAKYTGKEQLEWVLGVGDVKNKLYLTEKECKFF